MLPKETLWELKPHTRGKHIVLREYLKAWLPILGSWNTRILFIDGFAGPGKYIGGEDGSPIIALKAFCDHSVKHSIRAEVVYIFIEKERDRAEYLKNLIEKEWQLKLPDNCKVDIESGPFDEKMTQVLDKIDEQNKKLAPSFIMIDPFGVSGTPMSVIERIFKNPKCEVYISFMYESINRWITTIGFEKHLDELFGCKTWREKRNINNSNVGKHFLYNLYEEKLRESGAK